MSVSGKDQLPAWDGARGPLLVQVPFWPAPLTRLSARPQGHSVCRAPSTDEIVDAPRVSAAEWARAAWTCPPHGEAGKSHIDRAADRGLATRPP